VPRQADEAALLIADVYELAGLLRAAGEEVAATQGQSQARWQLLSVVSDAPRTVPQAARRLGLSRQAVQRVATDLIADDLAKALPNPDHRTSPLLALTPAGRRTLTGISRAAERFNSDLADTMGAREMAAVRRGVRTAIESIGSNR
jgi:DNA-binding MarR family transcriptional regulator